MCNRKGWDIASHHKNIYWNKGRGKWEVRVGYQRHSYFGGYFATIEEALAARQKLLDEFHKEFQYKGE